MQNQALAEQFIKKLAVYTPYNINIMDRSGIIIASKDEKRVGTLHEIACDILENNRDMVEVDADGDFLGVRSGINMAVRQENRVVGVIGITGRPDEVRPMAQIIKASYETMLEYEAQKEKSLRREGRRADFCRQLLEQADADPRALQESAERLGYREETPRAVMLFAPRDPAESSMVLELLSHTADRQDMLALNADRQVVFCRRLTKQDASAPETMKEELEQLWKRLCREGAELMTDCRVAVSLPQSRFSQYRHAYRHCRWLLEKGSRPGKPAFFSDWIDDYMKSTLPPVELHRVFYYYAEQLNENTRQLLISTIQALRSADYHMAEAAQILCVHKNTLAFRLQKLRQQLGMNPLQSMSDRAFLEYLVWYLKQKNAYGQTAAFSDNTEKGL